MTALVITVAQIAPVFQLHAATEIFSGIAGVALDYGQAVHFDANGRLIKSNSAVAGTAKFAGITLGKAALGQAVDILKRGHLYGVGVSGLAYAADAFLNDTDGIIGDAAGTVSVVIGTVVPLTDASRTKVLWVDADWLTKL